MKKYKHLIYILSIIIIIIMAYFIYKTFAQSDNEENISTKVKSEIEFLDNQFLGLFNQMNNIKFENYKISTKIITEEEKAQSSGESEEGSSEGSSSSEGGLSKETSSSTSDKSGSKNISGDTTTDKKYELQNNGILTQSSEIDWQNVKSHVENIYVLLSTITLDLYQTDINKDSIVNFNTEFDNLTKAVKDENKEQTLAELSILYDYLPGFYDECNVDKKSKIILKFKNSILKAYSEIDTGDWASISNNINNAVQEYTNLVASTEEDAKKQSSINKAYIRINELKNAVNLQDREVFLIKYKNTLEDLENI